MASIAPTAQKPGPLTRARFWASGFKERDTWVAYGFLLPWFIGFTIFIAGPMIASLVLSFTDYSVIQATNWVGTQNYHDLIHDPKVSKAMMNSLVYTLMSEPLEILTALVLALVLLRVGRMAGFFRTIFYLPKMTPPVAVAILYLLLFNGSNPTVTAPNFTLSLLLMVVIGGAGSRWGAVLGGILYYYLENRLGAVGSSSTVQGLPEVLRTPLEQPLFLLGTIFILIVFFLPGGIAGLAARGRPSGLRRLEEAIRPGGATGGTPEAALTEPQEGA